jgi:hypothetical protein
MTLFELQEPSGRPFTFRRVLDCHDGPRVCDRAAHTAQSAAAAADLDMRWPARPRKIFCPLKPRRPGCNISHSQPSPPHAKTLAARHSSNPGGGAFLPPPLLATTSLPRKSPLMIIPLA